VLIVHESARIVYLIADAEEDRAVSPSMRHVSVTAMSHLGAIGENAPRNH
jgi:hypothetical protein